MLEDREGDDVGDQDEGMAAVFPGQRAVVVGLELVAVLLGDALADLGGDFSRIQTRGDAGEDLERQPEVLQVGADHLLDADVLGHHPTSMTEKV